MSLSSPQQALQAIINILLWPFGLLFGQGGSYLSVSESPASVTANSIITVSASGGTPNGQYNFYAIDAANVKYQLSPGGGYFDANGNVTSTQTILSTMPKGAYSIFVTDYTTGNFAIGNIFTVR
jgi:hypothetical protein